MSKTKIIATLIIAQTFMEITVPILLHKSVDYSTDIHGNYSASSITQVCRL